MAQNDVMNIGMNVASNPSSPDLFSVLSQGQQALASGAVSEKEARAAQKKLGIDTPEKAADKLQQYLGVSQAPSNPYDFSGGQGQPAQQPPGAPQQAPMASAPNKLQTKNTQTTSQGSSSGMKRDVHATPEEASSVFDMVRGQPEVAGQEAGILAMQKQYDRMQNQKNPNDAWVKPLLALGDAVNHTDQASSFQSGTEKRQAALDKFANEIQQRRGDLSKSLIDSFTKLKTGQDQSAQNQKTGTNVYVGTNPVNPLSTSREVMQAQRTVNADPLLKQYIPRMDGATKILNLMDAAKGGDFKSNQAVLGQLNAEISRLETGSQSPGLGAAEKTEMQDAAAHYHNILDTLSGNVTGVDLTKKYEQAQGMVRDLGKSYVNATNDRMNTLKAGATEPQIPVFESKHNQLHQTYDYRFDAPVVVSNGKESHTIKPGPQQAQDLADAAAEGFKAVKK